jgi:hypothetical protein
MDSCPPGPPNPPEIEALYPSGSSPDDRRKKLSALCSYGQSPLVMTGALRQVLAQHFSDVRNILNSSLRARLTRDGVWSDGTDTGIVIESLTRWRPELTEARPGLILKSGVWQWQRMGIGDITGEDYRSGELTFGGYWQGSHTIFALAKEGAEAQILAIEVAKCLLWFGSEILEQLELQRFVPVSIGEVAALKESREHYVVPVVVAYVVPEFWKLQPDAPRTKRIVFRTSQTLSDY